MSFYMNEVSSVPSRCRHVGKIKSSTETQQFYIRFIRNLSNYLRDQFRANAYTNQILSKQLITPELKNS